MANWSDCNITLNGTAEVLKAVAEELQALIIEEDKEKDVLGYLEPSSLAPSDSIADKAGYSCIELDALEINDDNITISGQGRWCAPHGFFKELYTKHSLSGLYTDAEAGCNFFHVMRFEDGECTEDEEYNYFSKESIEHNGRENYLEEYQWITEEEDWENEYSYIVDVFLATGMTLDELKEEWDCSVAA